MNEAQQEKYDRLMKIALENPNTPEGDRAAREVHNMIVRQIVEQERQKGEQK